MITEILANKLKEFIIILWWQKAISKHHVTVIIMGSQGSWTKYIFYITGYALCVILSVANLLKFSYVTDRLIARASWSNWQECVIPILTWVILRPNSVLICVTRRVYIIMWLQYRKIQGMILSKMLCCSAWLSENSLTLNKAVYFLQLIQQCQLNK